MRCDLCVKMRVRIYKRCNSPGAVCADKKQHNAMLKKRQMDRRANARCKEMCTEGNMLLYENGTFR